MNSGEMQAEDTIIEGDGLMISQFSDAFHGYNFAVGNSTGIDEQGTSHPDTIPLEAGFTSYNIIPEGNLNNLVTQQDTLSNSLVHLPLSLDYFPLINSPSAGILWQDGYVGDTNQGGQRFDIYANQNKSQNISTQDAFTQYGSLSIMPQGDPLSEEGLNFGLPPTQNSFHYDQPLQGLGGTFQHGMFNDPITPHIPVINSGSQLPDYHGISLHVEHDDFNPSVDLQVPIRLPVPKQVKPKAPRISDEQWLAKKETIFQLWIQNNYTMNELREATRLFYGFTATERQFRNMFDKWGYSKNSTGRNNGLTTTQANDNGSPRKRKGAALPQKRPITTGSHYLADINSVPRFLPDNTPTHQEQSVMFNAIKKLIDGSFENRSVPWTYNIATLISSAGTPDGLKEWQLLLDQSYSIVTLADNGLFSRASSTLLRLCRSIKGTTLQSSPIALVYFWKICITLMGVPLPGMLRMKESPAFPLLLVFVERARHSFHERYHGRHPLINLLTAFFEILKEPTYRHEIREVLGRTYRMAIDILKATIGDDHPTVMNMTMHYNTNWKSKLELQAHLASCSKRYQFLIVKTDGEQRISLLYDYCYAMSFNDEINYTVVEELRRSAAEFCRAQEPLTGTVTSRAFVFATELLGKRGLDKTGLAKRGLDKRGLAKRGLAKRDLEKRELEKRELDDKRQQSVQYLEEAIDLLKSGDQECCVWAAHLSKKLQLWCRTDDRAKFITEKKRTREIRARIEVNEKAVVASRPLIEDSFNATLKHRQRVGIKLSETRKQVLSTTLVDLGIGDPVPIRIVVGSAEVERENRAPVRRRFFK